MTKYLLACWCVLGTLAWADDVTFTADFPGGSVGTVEKAEDGVYRVAMPRQYDEQRWNAQSTWFAFRMENLSGPVTLVFHDFDAVYNGHPTKPKWAGQCPVYSTDGETWTHVLPENSIWDNDARTLSVTIPFVGKTAWVAYTAMYTGRDLEKLKRDAMGSPFVKITSIGKSLEGREILRFTLTDEAVPETEKRVFYILARQHAWEANTSWQADGMVRFLISDAAAELRQKAVFHIVPIVDGDGAEHGRIRFNGNGYDVNRRWNEVDTTKTEMREIRPEVWYVKKDILDENTRKPLSLVVNLHNDTNTDYLDAAGDPTRDWPLFRAVDEALSQTNFYDPNVNHPMSLLRKEADKVPTTFDLWWGYQIPTLMIEQKVNLNHKTGQYPLAADSQARGVAFLKMMANVFLSARR